MSHKRGRPARSVYVIVLSRSHLVAATWRTVTGGGGSECDAVVVVHDQLALVRVRTVEEWHVGRGESQHQGPAWDGRIVAPTVKPERVEQDCIARLQSYTKRCRDRLCAVGTFFRHSLPNLW